MLNTNTKIAPKDMPFLEKVRHQANLDNVYEARDLTEVVYRTIRDLIPRETIERVASELEEEISPTEEQTMPNEIADLWRDTNPIVAWLSQIRPPFKGSAPFNIDDNLFITRVEQEGGMPALTNGQAVIKAVFAATKDELSQERIQEIAQFLPGKICQIWQQA